MATGRDTSLAFKKASTWGTAVSVNSALCGIYYTDLSGFNHAAEQKEDSTANFQFTKYVNNGHITVDVKITGELRYESQIWTLITFVMGGSTVSTIVANEYYHTLSPTITTSLFGTLVLYDGVTYREIPGFKASSFRLFTDGQFLKYELNGIGDTVKTTGQTNTTFSSVTYDSTVLRIPHGVGKFLINDQSGATLADPTDKICITNWELIFERAMNRDFTACGNSVANAGKTSVPVEEAAPTITFNFDLAEYTSKNFHDLMVAETLEKFQLSFTGGVIDTTNNYSMTISATAAKVVSFEADPSGQSRIPESISLRLLQAESNPSGMAYTDPVRITVVNGSSRDYDA